MEITALLLYISLMGVDPPASGLCWLRQQTSDRHMRTCEYGCEKGMLIIVIPVEGHCKPVLER